MFRIFRTLLFIGALLVAVASGIRLISMATPTRAAGANASVETTTVDRGDVAIAVNATGTIQAIQNVSLAFTNNGQVRSIAVKAGDTVRKGQTLATINNQSALDAVNTAQSKVVAQQVALNTLTAKPRQVDIDVAQANVKLAQAQLTESQQSGTSPTAVQQAQVSVDQAKNALWQAQLNRDINNQKKAALQANPKTAAAASNLPSDAQNDRSISSAQYGVTVAQDQLQSAQTKGASAGGIMSAQAAVTTAQAQLDQLLAAPNPESVKQAQDNLAAAQTALDQAKQTLNDTTLVAPFDGLVAQVNLNVGQIAPNSAAIILLDVSSFYVDLPVAELDIAKIKVGQTANMHFEALPNATIQGKVTQISNTANSGTPITYTVRITVDPAGQPLLSTMSTTASIITANAANVIRLPNRFIRIDRTKNAAYATVRQPDGSFKEVQIKIGTANDTYTEVQSGLKVGDVVATPGAAGTSGNNRGPGGPGGPFRFLGG